MAIRVRIPPPRPIYCFKVSFSLKRIIDIAELSTIALPFIRGKKS
jgi:hypothetical protein